MRGTHFPVTGTEQVTDSDEVHHVGTDPDTDRELFRRGTSHF